MKCTPIVLATTLLVIACSGDPASPEQALEQARHPAASFMNNPDVDNGVVFRQGSEFAVCWTDPSNGLRVCHRTQQFPGGECGVFDPMGGIGHQQVLAREDLDNFFASEIVVNMMGTLWITVRDLTQPGNCHGARKVAEGWGRFHYRDNDSFGPDGARDRTNSWAFSGSGQLTAPDGSTVQYSGQSRFVFNFDRGMVNSSATVNAR